MRKILFVAVALLGVASLSGCMGVVHSPALGILFTDVKWAEGGDAEGALGAKEGKACAQSILGLVAQGDASISAAAQNGGVTNVHTVEHSSRSILGIIGDYCTIVRGS
jgi:hypothetical protein